MKNLKPLGLLLTAICLTACKENKEPQTPKDALAAESFTKTECFAAIYEGDTIDLKINTLKNGKIAGNMEMRLENMPAKEGKIAGAFKGDTLFADYTFTQGANTRVTFRNPMAFLKKADQLILGNGKIETTLGASHFVTGEPIDFEKVKYKFSKSDCKE